jgi:hypothetical protein
VNVEEELIQEDDPEEVTTHAKAKRYEFNIV